MEPKLLDALYLVLQQMQRDNQYFAYEAHAYRTKFFWTDHSRLTLSVPTDKLEEICLHTPDPVDLPRLAVDPTTHFPGVPAAFQNAWAQLKLAGAL